MSLAARSTIHREGEGSDDADEPESIACDERRNRGGLPGACSDSTTAPDPVSPTLVRPSFVVAGTAVNSTPVPSEFRVCKAGNTAGNFTISRTPAGGGFGVGSTIITSITIQPGECYVVVEDDAPSGSGSDVTVTETNASNLTSITGQRISTVTGITTITPDPTNPFTDFINSIHGVVLTFTNTEKTGNEGCTPGYWKQEQHFGNWEPFAPPGPDFDTYFGVNFFDPNLNFLQALENGGGGVDALGRHAAAAILNAAASGVDCAYTTAQIIDIVQGDGAYTGLSVEDRKNLLADANEGVGGCPLARAELD
jgi:hypothetical protein